jgi:hypothetical protein
VAELARCWVKTAGVNPNPELSGVHHAGEHVLG